MITSLAMIIIGFLIVSSINRGYKNILENLALGFLFGFGLLSLSLFILTAFNIRLNLTVLLYTTVALFLLSLASFLLTNKDLHIKPFRRKVLPSFKKENVIWVFIIFLIAASFIMNFYWPVSAWDSLAVYDSRAKIYAEGGLLNDLWQQTGKDPIYFGYYYNSYPPSTSLAHSMVYFLHDSPVGIFYSIFYAVLLILFYINLAKISNKTNALIFTFVLSAMPKIYDLSVIAYTNLPYTTYFSLSVFYLSLCFIKKDMKMAVISAILLTFSIWIRALDPFYGVILLILFLLFIFKRNKINFFVLSITAALTLVMKFGWTFYANSQFYKVTEISYQNYSLFNNVAMGHSSRIIEELVTIIKFIVSSLNDYKLILMVFLLGIILSPLHIKKNLIPFLTIVISLALLLPGTAVISLNLTDWQGIGDSVKRLMVILYPLVIFYVASIPEVASLAERFIIKK